MLARQSGYNSCGIWGMCALICLCPHTKEFIMGQSVKFHVKIKRGGALLYHSLSCCRMSIFGGVRGGGGSIGNIQESTVDNREGNAFITMHR